MKRHAKPRDFRTVQSQNGVQREPSAFDDLYSRVALLAYSLYEGRGREHGHDVDDWIQAENAIRDEMALQQNGGRARKRV